jgi:large subunit ribosomal protein L30
MVKNMAESKKQEGKRWALVRVRGPVRVNIVVNDTLRMLHLERTHYCTVIDSNAANDGMIQKAKDYIAYGEVDEATYKMLIEKKAEPFMGRLTDSKGEIQYRGFIVVDGKKIKPYFRLAPPRGGYERKGIKLPFTKGGALGYRGIKINDLIKRMI